MIKSIFFKIKCSLGFHKWRFYHSRGELIGTSFSEALYKCKDCEIIIPIDKVGSGVNLGSLEFWYRCEECFNKFKHGTRT